MRRDLFSGDEVKHVHVEGKVTGRLSTLRAGLRCIHHRALAYDLYITACWLKMHTSPRAADVNFSFDQRPTTPTLNSGWAAHPAHDWHTTHYLRLTTYYLLPTTYYPLPTTYSLLPTPYSLLPTHYSLLPTTYYPLPTAYYLLPTPYSLLHMIDYVLHTAYYILHFVVHRHRPEKDPHPPRLPLLAQLLLNFVSRGQGPHS